MSDFYRHVVSGDLLTVRFRYHHTKKADLEITIFDVAKALRGQGVLASDGKFAIKSSVGPDFSDKTLYVFGNNKDLDGKILKLKFATLGERDELLTALSCLIDEINGKPIGSGVPEFLGGPGKSVDFDMALIIDANKIKGDYNPMIRNDLKNILGGTLTIDCPGKDGASFKAYKPENKDQLMVVFDAGADNARTESFDLLDGVKVSDIKVTVDKGQFIAKVTYNPGAAIDIG
jgi:hypothetical protein